MTPRPDPTPENILTPSDVARMFRVDPKTVEAQAPGSQAMRGHLQRVYSRLIIDPETGCLLWTGALDPAGYGRTWDSRTKKQARIHQLMWEIANGPVPDGMELDHVKERGCRNRHCGNVDHLEIVTHAENMRRRIQTHCLRGHEKTPDNTYVYGNNRICKACRKLRRKTA